ncbi:MAG: hypothetical protein B7Y25_03825 [Alphaproteobacteria bacterium 16-39-46]|nr:MAG: hypothetical protein B7Y25_03825 [Alphaproteobacteria bacterium 16-39-46]OZA43287.1 MAG: hypothetical protein B7X84_03660 [Alphaproteobacteria bacterium 17-39-52]HQS84065.1 hypothetical protein [Alphaproteobacteria bacterium]
MENFFLLRDKNDEFPCSLIYVESPQILLESAILLINNREERLSSNLFYSCSFENCQTFGVSLWAYAYEACNALWKERHLRFKEDPSFFPFLLDVRTSSGFIFLGLRLELKYFLCKKDLEIFTKLQTLVRNQGGELYGI